MTHHLTPVISKFRQLLRRTRSSKAARNIALSYFSFFSSAAWTFISTPLAVFYLSKEEIGLWAVVNVILSYFAWMDFGISHATGRLIAPAVANNQQKEINRIWTAISVCLLGQAFFVIILGFSALPLIMLFLDVEGALSNDTFWTLVLGIFFAASSIPLCKIPGLLIAQERFYWIPVVMGLVPWCNLALFYIFLRSGYGLKSYAAAMLGGQVVNWICYTLVVRLGPQTPNFDKSGISREQFSRLFSFSSGLMVFSVVDSFLQTLPTMMISRLGGISMVPVYNFSAKGSQMGAALVSRTYQAFQPRWMRSYLDGKITCFKTQYDSAGYMTLGLGALAAAFILIFNPILVRLLAGQEYMPSPFVHLWLAVAVITTPMGLYLQSLINLSGRVGHMPAYHILKLFLSIPLGLLSWKLFGLCGIVFAFSLIPLANAIFGYWLGNSHCGFSGSCRAGTGPYATTLFTVLVISIVGFTTMNSDLLNISVIAQVSSSTIISSGTCFVLGSAYLALSWSIKCN